MTMAPFELINQRTVFYEIWYERYATGGHPTLYFSIPHISNKKHSGRMNLQRWRNTSAT
jgi:hypothetical protein